MSQIAAKLRARDAQAEEIDLLRETTNVAVEALAIAEREIERLRELVLDIYKMVPYRIEDLEKRIHEAVGE